MSRDSCCHGFPTGYAVISPQTGSQNKPFLPQVVHPGYFVSTIGQVTNTISKSCGPVNEQSDRVSAGLLPACAKALSQIIQSVIPPSPPPLSLIYKHYTHTHTHSNRHSHTYTPENADIDTHICKTLTYTQVHTYTHRVDLTRTYINTHFRLWVP